MRTLPDAPSLDHLRQQAKDLVGELRVVRPDATLSDAQALVAEQYGFRTWPEAEVDRRSAAIRMVDAGAAGPVAKAFDLGTPQGPLVAVERQWAGQAWSLATDRGRWLVRGLFDWFNASVDTEVLLAEAATGAGLRTPRPVRSRAGAVIETLDGTRWRVYELLAVGPEPSVPADARHAAAAGRIVGRVHGLGLPASHPITSWLTCVRPESLWRELQHAADAADMAWADQVGEAIPAILDVSALVDPPGPGDERVLSACNYAPNAFRVAGPDDLVVMSWEHAGATLPRWDLGATLAAWSQGVLGGVHPAAANALVAGYAEEADLPDPLDLSIFSAYVCASLSWLASRIRIAVDAAESERREIADRAVPWLLPTLPSPAKLQAILDAVR